MNTKFTAILKRDDNWWIGWIEEIPGVIGQEEHARSCLKQYVLRYAGR